jgi:aminopeptidase-like protein
MFDSDLGRHMYELACKLFPYNRSLTGNGVRKTLKDIKKILPDLTIFEVESGSKVFDWEIPDEWDCQDAYIVTPSGKKICNFKENNLHVVGYSTFIDDYLSLTELQKKLYSKESLPEAIPYVTSYYERDWGFSISHKQRQEMEDGQYRVYIDSKHKKGHLTYGEVILKSDAKARINEEVFLSTYICHPSLANNEISGPVVTTYLLKWIKNLKNRRFDYRAVFIPETIGSITYLSKNYQKLKENVTAGFNITCVGDDNAYSFLPSRNGNTLSDIVAKHVLKHHAKDFQEYSFLDRGSDERQYCSPGIDLPVASIMRTKYGEYEQYHTSLDNLDYISDKGLYGAFKALALSIICIENNKVYKYTNLCEPQLGKRGLRSSVGAINNMTQFNEDVINVLAYADGKIDLISIAIEIDRPLWELIMVVEKLVEHNLLIEV